MYKTQKVILVVARQISDNPNYHGGIGIGNDLLYKGLPGDMKRFKKISQGEKGGNVNIMGRKNFESIPEPFRPFKDGRITVVISHNDHPEIDSLTNCKVVHSIEEALEYAHQHYPDRDIVVNGGGEIYSQMLAHCDIIYSTDITGNLPADAFFILPEGEFIQETYDSQPSHNGISYAFANYVRKK